MSIYASCVQDTSCYFLTIIRYKTVSTFLSSHRELKTLRKDRNYLYLHILYLNVKKNQHFPKNSTFGILPRKFISQFKKLYFSEENAILATNDAHI